MGQGAITVDALGRERKQGRAVLFGEAGAPRVIWPWDDRGRSKVTRADVFRDLMNLAYMVQASPIPGMREVVRGLPKCP